MPGEMNLPQGACCDGRAIKAREQFVHRLSEFTLDLSNRLVGREGGNTFLKFLQLNQHPRRDKVRSSAHHLSKLNECRPELFQCHPNSFDEFQMTKWFRRRSTE